MNDSRMRVYFDYNATTPLAPEVVEAVVARHARSVRQRLERASLRPAGQGGARRGAIGGRRADRRRSVRGRVHERRHRGRQLRAFAAPPRRSSRPAAGTSSRARIEHEAVLNTLKALARRGWTHDARAGRSVGHRRRPIALREALTDDTALVSVMHANNEIGTIQPIAELAAHRARARRADAHRRRAVGRQDSRRRARARRRPAVALGAQVQRAEGRRRALDQARHAAAADPDRRQARAQPARRHRERRRRSSAWAWPRGWRARSWPPRRARVGALRDRLEAGILAAVPGTAVNGARDAARAEHDQHQLRPRRGREPADRARPRRHRGVDRIGLLVGHARAVARAAGDGASRRTATQNSLRFSLGLFSTDAEVDRVIDVLPRLVEKLRGADASRSRCSASSTAVIARDR